MDNDHHRALPRRYYEDLWNKWHFDRAPTLLDHRFIFHGSLGFATQGIAEFIQYMNRVRQAFSEFTNTIERLIGGDGCVVAQLSYRGTHLGPLFTLKPTGRSIRYAGIAIFRLEESLLTEGWVLGDMYDLMQQLGAIGAT